MAWEELILGPYGAEMPLWEVLCFYPGVSTRIEYIGTFVGSIVHIMQCGTLQKCSETLRTMRPD